MVLVLPLFPGISLVCSGHSTAPRSGYTSLKLVFWYGFGAIELLSQVILVSELRGTEGVAMMGLEASAAGAGEA